MSDLQETIDALERAAKEIREQSIPGWGNAIDAGITLLKSQAERIAEVEAKLKRVEIDAKETGVWLDVCYAVQGKDNE